MKILFLNTLHPYNDGRIYYKEAISLSKESHQVIILGPYEDVNSFDVNITIKGYGKAKYFKRLMNTIHLFKSCWKEKADVLQCNELDSWFVGVIIGKIKKIPVIFDAHEYYPSRFQGKITSPIEKLARTSIKIFMYILSINSTIIITVSEQLKNLYSFLKCSVVIVHNYALITNNVSLTALKGKKDHYPVLIHIGYVNANRGIDIMIKGIKKLKNRYPKILLIIVGKHNDTIKKQNEIRQLINDLEVGNNITFTGWINFADVPEYLAISHVGIILFQNRLFNNSIGLPHKFFEYLQAGLPVIVPNKSILAEYVNKYNVGKGVDSSNIDSFVNGILKLISERENLDCRKNRIKKLASKEFSWDTESKKYIKIFGKIAK